MQLAYGAALLRPISARFRIALSGLVFSFAEQIHGNPRRQATAAKRTCIYSLEVYGMGINASKVRTVVFLMESFRHPSTSPTLRGEQQRGHRHFSN
jgi:hypothetical protein